MDELINVDPTQSKAKIKPQIGTMWRRYGKNDQAFCRDCCHLIKREVNEKTYYKCDLYDMGSSEAGDWSKSWNGCGQFSTGAKCLNCDKGSVLVFTPGFIVSREMAQDAGDLSMEGATMGENEDYQDCPCCGGDWQDCKNCKDQLDISSIRDAKLLGEPENDSDDLDDLSVYDFMD